MQEPYFYVIIIVLIPRTSQRCVPEGLLISEYFTELSAKYSVEIVEKQ